MSTIDQRVASLARTALAASLLLGAIAASAQLPDPYQGRSEWSPTDAEVVLLPAYCRSDMRPQLYPGPGTQAYGCGVWINHLCPGLAAINRAMNPLLPMKARQGWLRAAEDHLQYTRGHLAPTCRLAADLQVAEQQTGILRKLIK